MARRVLRSSTAIIRSQRPAPWVATTSALMSLKWLSCLASTLRPWGLTVGVRGRHLGWAAEAEVSAFGPAAQQDSRCLGRAAAELARASGYAPAVLSAIS